MGRECAGDNDNGEAACAFASQPRSSGRHNLFVMCVHVKTPFNASPGMKKKAENATELVRANATIQNAA